jgi:hypothetical protein
MFSDGWFCLVLFFEIRQVLGIRAQEVYVN